MALVLRSNPLGKSTGALFVSNPRKRKPNRKTRRNAKKVARKNTSRKKRVIRLKKRKNPVRKKRSVRKNGTKKGMMRKTSRRAYSKRRNPARKTRRNAIKMKRKNPVRRRKSTVRRRKRTRMNPMRKMLRKNPEKGFVPSLIKSAKDIIRKVPYVGKPIADNLAVSVSGMLGGLAFVASYNYLSGKLDAQSAKMPDSFIIKSLNTTNKYAGYALLGVLGKVVTKQKFAKDLLGETADIVGNGILMAGGLFQALRYYNIYAGKYGKQTLELAPAPSLNGEVSTSGIHMGRYGRLGRYGDGGSYDVVPLAGAHMRGAHMSGAHMRGAHMSGAHMHGAHMHGVHKMGMINKNDHMGGIHMSRNPYSGLVMESPMSGLVVDNMAGLAVVGTAV